MLTDSATTRRSHLHGRDVLLLLLVGLAASVTVAMAQTTALLEGTVTSSDGTALAGVMVTLEGADAPRTTTTDSEGRYRLPGIPAGSYTLGFRLDAFRAHVVEELVLQINRRYLYDVEMDLGFEATVEVVAEVPLLDAYSADTGAVITPEVIDSQPVNGRDYIDLVQLVPGVTVQRQADAGSDEAAPVLGERAGNSIFLIDGMPNRSELTGGPATQFNQDTIYEFEVLTDGYKAEMGHGSGAVVNVLTKSGGNELRGRAFLFLRDDALDSSNSLDPAEEKKALDRIDLGLTLGGPIRSERAWFFASAEVIEEERELNFSFPAGTPAVVAATENGFDEPSNDEQIRLFGKAEQKVGRHRLTQQVSFTDQELTEFLPLSAARSLPSTRQNLERDRLMIGLRDSALLGGDGDATFFEAYLQVRDESDGGAPSHPDAGPNTTFLIFSAIDTFSFGPDLGLVSFGAALTPSSLDQEYVAAGTSGLRSLGVHDLKVGFDYLGTKVDGSESSLRFNQLFATVENFERFGPIYSGLFTLNSVAPGSPGAERIRLRNDHWALFAQDDWRAREDLTLSFGVRVDRDSEFAETQVAPRLGAVWRPNDRMVLRASGGLFYDRYRLGLVRQAPAFGGADLRLSQPLSYPQLFYNLTSAFPVTLGLCISPTATSAQIAASGVTCPFGPLPFWGVDHLSNLVAPGFDPIPPQTVVTIDNVEALTGLSPDEFLAAVTAAAPLIFLPGAEWFWGPFGALSHTGIPEQSLPVDVAPGFDTPYSRAFNLGFERRVGDDWAVYADYHHRDIRNILGSRNSNLLFEARIPGRQLSFEGGELAQITTFGPWFEGEVDALVVGFRKRFSRGFELNGHYTYTDAVDNVLHPNLTDVLASGGPAFPSDSFIGVPPVVFDPTTGQSNENGPFIAGNGNPVPQAGVFYNGPDLDRGPSDLALEHQILVYGRFALPGKLELSGIARWASGFPYSPANFESIDVDGNLNILGRDPRVGRNAETGPSFANLDVRLARTFRLGARIDATVLVEVFNALNEQNPAAVETQPRRLTALGEPLQVLPGREGQLGLRLEF